MVFSVFGVCLAIVKAGGFGPPEVLQDLGFRV